MACAGRLLHTSKLGKYFRFFRQRMPLSVRSRRLIDRASAPAPDAAKAAGMVRMSRYASDRSSPCRKAWMLVASKAASPTAAASSSACSSAVGTAAAAGVATAGGSCRRVNHASTGPTYGRHGPRRTTSPATASPRNHARTVSPQMRRASSGRVAASNVAHTTAGTPTATTNATVICEPTPIVVE